MLTVQKNEIPLEGQNVFPPQERQCPAFYIHYCTTTTYYRIKPLEQVIEFFFQSLFFYKKKKKEIVWEPEHPEKTHTGIGKAC